MTRTSNADRQAALRERERAAGIVRKLVRIPAKRSDELDEIVADWMEQHRKPEESTDGFEPK